MYLLGDDENFTKRVLTALHDSNGGTKGYDIQVLDEVRIRCAIIYAINSASTMQSIDGIVEQISALFHEGSVVIFIRENWSETDKEIINQKFVSVHSAQLRFWRAECHKLNAHNGCQSRDERIREINQWCTEHLKHTIRFLCIQSLSETSLKECVASITNKIYCFEEQSKSNLTEKPPPLHWSNYPREDELQLTFLFKFPFHFLLAEDLETVINQCSESLLWTYAYQWIDGILLRHEETRIGIVRHTLKFLELSGRIDLAEIDDDVENVLIQDVWPYLAIVFDSVLMYLKKMDIPYQLSILPIGEKFYSKKIELHRSFDVTDFLISIDLHNRVAFRFNNETVEVNLNELFGANWRPKTISDLVKDKASHHMKSVKSNVDINNTNSLSVSHITTNKGRRVSFGSINCITQQFTQGTSQNEEYSKYHALHDRHSPIGSALQIIGGDLQDIEF